MSFVYGLLFIAEAKTKRNSRAMRKKMECASTWVEPGVYRVAVRTMLKDRCPSDDSIPKSDNIELQITSLDENTAVFQVDCEEMHKKLVIIGSDFSSKNNA